MDTQNKDKIMNKLAELFSHMTSDAYEIASRRAVLICFALKYALGIGIYIALRNFVGQIYGEAWMAFVFAYALYGQELYISTKIKEGLVKTVLEEQINDDEEEEDVEDSNDIEDSKEEKKS